MRYEWNVPLQESQVFALYKSVGWTAYTENIPV